MNKAIFALCFSAISLFCYGITKETKVGDIDGSTVTVGNLLDVSDGQITVSKKKVSSDNRVKGETSTTYRANQQGTLTTEELGALNSVTGGLVNGLYPGFVHINPSLSVGWSKFHDFQSYNPIDADTVQPVIFSAGASIHTRAQNAITLGWGVNNTNNYSFVWSGDASRNYTPTKWLDTSYGTKYNGGFHVNPSVRQGMTSPLENFWIGDTNLAMHISSIIASSNFVTVASNDMSQIKDGGIAIQHSVTNGAVGFKTFANVDGTFGFSSSSVQINPDMTVKSTAFGFVADNKEIQFSAVCADDNVPRYTRLTLDNSDIVTSNMAVRIVKELIQKLNLRDQNGNVYKFTIVPD